MQCSSQEASKRLTFIDRVCRSADQASRVRTVVATLIDFMCYTYANYVQKLGDPIFSATYTLYLVYTPSMLRDIVLTVLASREIMPYWKEIFYVVSSALTLHLVVQEVVSFSVRPSTGSGRVSLRDVSEVVEEFKRGITKLCNINGEVLQVVAHVFAISVITLTMYLCAIPSEVDVDDHIRQVLEYAINESSRTALSEFYNLTMMATG